MLCHLREKGIRADLYPGGARMKKQRKYADRINARYILILGSEEMENKAVSIKDMQTGDQKTVPLAEVVELIRDNQD